MDIKNSDFNRLDDLLDTEANIVSVCYSHSAVLGDKMLSNSLNSFGAFLSNRHKDYIPQLSNAVNTKVVKTIFDKLKPT